MRHYEHPNIGHWYKDNRSHTLFEVVATDNENNIEIQLVDGTIEELEPREWYDMVLEEMAAPEDWSGAATENDALDSDYLDIHDGLDDINSFYDYQPDSDFD